MGSRLWFPTGLSVSLSISICSFMACFPFYRTYHLMVLTLGLGLPLPPCFPLELFFLAFLSPPVLGPVSSASGREHYGTQ